MIPFTCWQDGRVIEIQLLTQLRKLEVELHQPEVRTDADRLNSLLHESFREIGRSGRLYQRDEIAREVLTESSPPLVWSQDFAVEEIAEGIALLTYRSAHIDETGMLYRHSLRCSFWQRTILGWQMRFHQGTPTDEFSRSET